MLDAQSGYRTPGHHPARRAGIGFHEHGSGTLGERIALDGGGASRFFYHAKASRADRGEGNVHPTVKPTALMRYLCRLVTPPGGTVLDLFCGSGSTGKACVYEGLGFVGVDQDEESLIMARARILAALRHHAPPMTGLFAEDANP